MERVWYPPVPPVIVPTEKTQTMAAIQQTNARIVTMNETTGTARMRFVSVTKSAAVSRMATEILMLLKLQRKKRKIRKVRTQQTMAPASRPAL